MTAQEILKTVKTQHKQGFTLDELNLLLEKNPSINTDKFVNAITKKATMVKGHVLFLNKNIIKSLK